MSTIWKQLGTVILASLVLILLGLGVQACRPLSPTFTPIPTPSPTATLPTEKVAMVTPAIATSTQPAVTPSPATPTPTATLPPCGTPPAGWVTYIVQPGDALSVLAQVTGISQELLMQANCLTKTDILVGQRLYLPGRPTPGPCGSPPAGWAPYTVRSGETLSELAFRAGETQARVQEVNCLPTADLWAGQRIYLPPLPEPTASPCVPAPRAGWRSYTVQAGDTLFGLAVARGTTLDEVMRVNCLTSTAIQAGQALYLPPMVIAPASPPPLSPGGATIAPVTPGTAPSASATPVLPDLVLAPGGPNNPAFVPCRCQRGTPWISVETETLDEDTCQDRSPEGARDLQHGQRAFYFACEFPDPAALTATMTGPNGAQTLDDVLSYLPNPDLNMGQAQRVVIWNATCDPSASPSVGPYTLTLDDGHGHQASLAFTLAPTLFQRILTVPQVAAAWTTFQVYYCGYGAQAGQGVTIDRYYEASRRPDGGYVFRYADSWTVTINANGWVTGSLTLSPNNARGTYLLRDRPQALKGWDQIWLVR